VAELIPRASCESQGYGGGTITLPQPGGPGPHMYNPQVQDGPVQSQCHVMTEVSQSVYLGA
jgi:hypothetical protein